MQTSSMVGKVLLLAGLGISVGLSAAACNNGSSDDENSGGEASGGKATGGKASGGASSGGDAGSNSGGDAGAGGAGSNSGGDAGAGGAGPDSELQALCSARCEVTIQLDCPGSNELESCVAGCVDASEFYPECLTEYKANVQCEAEDDVEGFDCFEYGEVYFLVQSAETACAETYEDYSACGT